VTKPFQLYRQFDAAGALLYVGVSTCIKARTASHKSTSPWFGEIARVDTETFPTHEAARAAEAAAIKTRSRSTTRSERNGLAGRHGLYRPQSRYPD
jgi:hypothetical protein